MKPSLKLIFKMQYFSLINTVLGLFSCRLDSVGGRGRPWPRAILETTPGVGTAFVSSVEG